MVNNKKKILTLFFYSINTTSVNHSVIDQNIINIIKKTECDHTPKPRASVTRTHLI